VRPLDGGAALLVFCFAAARPPGSALTVKKGLPAIDTITVNVVFYFHIPATHSLRIPPGPGRTSPSRVDRVRRPWLHRRTKVLSREAHGRSHKSSRARLRSKAARGRP